MIFSKTKSQMKKNFFHIFDSFSHVQSPPPGCTINTETLCIQILTLYIMIDHLHKKVGNIILFICNKIYVCFNDPDIFLPNTIIFYYNLHIICRVVGNWWYKRKGGDSTRKKKSKI